MKFQAQLYANTQWLIIFRIWNIDYHWLESSMKEVLNSTLKVICSGDKFNAMTEALSAILNFIDIPQKTPIHMVYAENIDSTDLSFQNFKLPLKISDNKLSLSLGSDNEEIEHFESDHVPFSKIITELDLKYPSYILHENNFLFLFGIKTN